MQHFVHNLEGYLSNQILNVTWSEFQEGLVNVSLFFFELGRDWLADSLDFLIDRNNYKILESDWLSTDLISALIVTITIFSNLIRALTTLFFANYCVGLKSDTWNRTVTSANHIKCTHLNPPITEFTATTIATTTYPTNLGIFQNEQMWNIRPWKGNSLILCPRKL